ncbi:MAG: bifunctional adenosylcobinamide kinase/adenosylcobinamide-phosphate guanylyltransferase [Thiohalocapsa sp.]|nr:bifunctional adenosylcobinamide kinase/adenosylcobinamide-phosphate guanylyltransferase [Thiohalocapsa sp.]MCF7991692.1 bifunctional adenosylcobinamide kinase/adenosylcobinamide-phosphate guanylyltransferase [Thiohalocapsa sp.]
MSVGRGTPNHASPVLVTGPARSGKSEWAERLALESGQAVVYIATARENPNDAEWSARISAHRARRPERWLTVCAPTGLAAAIDANDAPGQCLLVDSLGTWTANLVEEGDGAWRDEVSRLLRCLAAASGSVILVAEETAWGVIPAYPAGRIFRDRLGDLIRRIGPICGAAYLVTGGYALDLKRLGTPLD